MYLLYCILPTPHHKITETLYGLYGNPVSLVTCNGLTSVISFVTLSVYSPEIVQLMNYKKVIETLHRSHTVIPIRYGCVFDKESQVLQDLEDRGEQYKMILGEIDGCVEMGVRMLFSGSESQSMNSMLDRDSSTTPDPPGPGQTYLSSRRRHYSEQKNFTKDIKEIMERSRTAFAPLFIKCKTEYPDLKTDRGKFCISLPSIYFLIMRSSVDKFLDVFREISDMESVKLILSGPWPPYNFVSMA